MILKSFSILTILGVLCSGYRWTFDSKYPRFNVICAPGEVHTKMCNEIHGDIYFVNTSFDDTIQERFHWLRILRGRVILDNANLTVLDAFKNLVDIIIEDPANMDFNWKINNPGFLVTNNRNLKEIHMQNLLSFTSTYDLGFRIYNNGDYKMTLDQKNKIFRKTGNRNLYQGIELQLNDLTQTADLYTHKYVAVAITAILGVSFIAIGGLLVNLCFVSKKSADSMEFFERILNETDEQLDVGVRRIKGLPRQKGNKIDISERDQIFL